MYVTGGKWEISGSSHVDTMYGAAPPPHKKTCTTHNNISPCTNDGVINSPVPMNSFLLRPAGNTLPPLDTVELLSVDCGTSMSGNICT